MRKKAHILMFFLITLHIANGQEIPIPKNYTIIDSTVGDLNNDNINELVVAYNIEPEKDFESVPRELIIYKLENNKWNVWKKSKDALYGSRDGGMMSDPFGEIKIIKGILFINQNGGSSWKWDHTDKYRFQENEFYLIGYVANYGRPCDYWTMVDFNLSTGKMIVKKEYESCENGDEQKIFKRENEAFYKKGLKITLGKRNEKELKIISPKFKHEIYISTYND